MGGPPVNSEVAGRGRRRARRRRNRLTRRGLGRRPAPRWRQEIQRKELLTGPLKTGSILEDKGYVVAMNVCPKCKGENEDAAARCRHCGSELVRASSQPLPDPEPLDADFEKIAVLDSEVQAELLDEVLCGQKIPHLMRTYHDSAYDGIFQSQMGWGHVAAPARFRAEILSILENLKRQAEPPEEPQPPENA